MSVPQFHLYIFMQTWLKLPTTFLACYTQFANLGCLLKNAAHVVGILTSFILPQFKQFMEDLHLGITLSKRFEKFNDCPSNPFPLLKGGETVRRRMDR